MICVLYYRRHAQVEHPAAKVLVELANLQDPLADEHVKLPLYTHVYT